MMAMLNLLIAPDDYEKVNLEGCGKGRLISLSLTQCSYHPQIFEE